MCVHKTFINESFACSVKVIELTSCLVDAFCFVLLDGEYFKSSLNNSLPCSQTCFYFL